MTGYADIGGAQPDTGGEKLLKKPFRLHELRGAVRGALEHRAEAESAAPEDARLAPHREPPRDETGNRRVEAASARRQITPTKTATPVCEWGVRC